MARITPSRPSRSPARAGQPSAREVRCCCGSLLARLVDEGVEIKCRRCKTVQVIPTTCRDLFELAPAAE